MSFDEGGFCAWWDFRTYVGSVVDLERMKLAKMVAYTIIKMKNVKAWTGAYPT